MKMATINDLFKKPYAKTNLLFSFEKHSSNRALVIKNQFSNSNWNHPNPSTQAFIGGSVSISMKSVLLLKCGTAIPSNYSALLKYL